MIVNVQKLTDFVNWKEWEEEKVMQIRHLGGFGNVYFALDN